MRRGDLEKLRRLDSKLAAQLEDVLAQREAAAEEPQGDCGVASQSPRRLRSGVQRATCDESRVPSPAIDVGSLTCRAESASQSCTEGFRGATPPQQGARAERSEGACGEPSSTRPSFVNAESQVGLPEVPQVLVSTEASPAEKLAEVWEGYDDDAVPAEELSRRKAERKAEREAQMAQYRANARQLGCLPWAKWRRHGTGEHVSCAQLELQLDGIERRVGRASTWDEGLSATRTMEHVEAQCFAVRDLGDRFDNMPSCLRGLFPELTPSQRSLLRAVVTAYLGGAMGIYEYQPILASDLGMSERALRYALNGGKDRPPGLVELGLVTKRQTWKRGAGDRPSDHHYLLLQAGPTLTEVLLPLACEGRTRRGERLPRHCGYTRNSARQAARVARQSARRSRFEHAEQAVERTRREAKATRPAPQRERRERVEKRSQIAGINCPAQNADNPVPPPSGEGGLRIGRGRPPSPPKKNVSLRDEPLAPATPPPEISIDRDSSPPKINFLGDRARALDGGAQPAPSVLERWRQRKRRGAQVPDEIDKALFANLISSAREALFAEEP